MDKNHNLDSTDFKILKVLQENGKISNLNLSKTIGLSPAPTLERVKKLEQNGIIESYHAKLNKGELGLHLQALIQVTLVRQVQDAAAKFLAKAEQVAEVVEIYQVTGAFDYQLTVHAKSISDFERLIREQLAEIEEIGSMQTMVVLNKIKDSKLLPLDYPE
ncbi:Lrp/AsnC family transcriptional regulator [Luteibaculum oceani]|uniref:Lrp/AsnC family transcriptional regulator n=1 Tax=Luteibaculum oceani TaxID=1294296 RepID=A0A5C6VID2_9FLAO|nr:Lrp/AsnC family transcriptional regulator [Luteibaculum oceani]TXC85103.1 Lrp/AsnC family transcriptional regulator [Luteibaculum oceani]